MSIASLSEDLCGFAVELRRLAYTMPGGHEDSLIRLSERMVRHAQSQAADSREHRTGDGAWRLLDFRFSHLDKWLTISMARSVKGCDFAGSEIDGRDCRLTRAGAAMRTSPLLRWRILDHDVCMAGTILGMKPLPLEMFARNWVRAVNPARGRLIGAMVVVMCAANLVAAAAADADTPCKLWRFDGYTQFDFPDGGKMTFIKVGRLINFSPMTEVWAIPPNGGAPTLSKIWGGIGFQEGAGEWGLGNTIWMERFFSEGPRQFFNGNVTDDGFAYGVAFSTGTGRSSSWRSAAPLRCADFGG